MTVSLLRTIAIGQRSSLYGVVSAPLRRWPVAEPEDLLDYSLDITALLADVADTVISAQVSVSPSGLGELAASGLAVAGGVVTLMLGGGVCGRDYVIQIACQTEAARTFGFRVGLAIDNPMAAYPNTPPSSPGFGPPVVWGDPALSNLLTGADGAYLVGADGAALTLG